MKNWFSRLAITFCVIIYLIISDATACTSMLVTGGATVDGSVMITYTCDGRFHPRLDYTPAMDYEPEDSLEIKNWAGEIRGIIKQVEHTYAVVDLMNEHQLAIGETTFEGRQELRNPDGILHYWDLMNPALQRTKTAREALKMMTELVEEYGYGSTGESISIADTKEVWLLEIIGLGPERKGAVWVARRVPDGYICAHANKAVIGEFPLDDPDNCIYSENVISFAIENGYYDPKSGEPFRFNEAYCPSTPRNQRYGAMRVWSLFRRAAPSLDLSPDYHRAVEGAKPYPLWIKPDEKLTVSDVFSLMRDHYEGTDFDMTKGMDAGPYGAPNRWRPMVWEVDSIEYVWERPISTQQTGFSFVSQSRSWLPDPIGGVYWYGVDDTYTTCYVPLYCGIDSIPSSYTKKTGGSLQNFTWDSAWWVFNFVANYANLKYSLMIEDIKAVQQDLENKNFAIQPEFEKTAIELAGTDPELLTKYLTDYSVTRGEMTVSQWRELGEFLIRKYSDGYVQDEKYRSLEKGYPDEWLRKVISENPDKFKLPEKENAVPESKLVD